MMTVVDQVSPWLTPRRTLANTIQPQLGAAHQDERHRQADDPAGDEDGFAAEAVRQRAGEEVGGGFHGAERDDEGQRGGERGEAEHLVGEERQDGAFLADHAADERVDADEQRELGEVLPQTEPDRAAVVHSTSSVSPVAFAQSSGPPSSTRRSRAPLAARTLAPVIARSPCPHITVTGPSGSDRVADGAELDVRRAGQVPGGELVALADVDDGADDCVGFDERDRRSRQAGVGPRADAAVEHTDKALRSRRRGTGARARGCLGRRRGRTRVQPRVDEPAEPRREHGPQCDRQCAGNVAGRELGDGPGVDDDRASCDRGDGRPRGRAW